MTNPIRDRVAAALYERERPPRDPHWADAYPVDREVFEAMADSVTTALARELAALAEYEHTINWMTTCTSCARVLDSAYAETVRRETAETTLAEARRLHREACPLASGKVGAGFTCTLCAALAEPADPTTGRICSGAAPETEPNNPKEQP